jgi:hypothetical protein
MTTEREGDGLSGDRSGALALSVYHALLTQS